MTRDSFVHNMPPLRVDLPQIFQMRIMVAMR
jgi:hypothetical protein